MNKANETKELFSGLFGDIKRTTTAKPIEEDYEDEYYDEELDNDDAGDTTP